MVDNTHNDSYNKNDGENIIPWYVHIAHPLVKATTIVKRRYHVVDRSIVGVRPCTCVDGACQRNPSFWEWNLDETHNSQMILVPQGHISVD